MKFAVLDFETTGDQPTDEIIQVGLVLINEYDITERFTSLVKPSRRIPAMITQLTGISNEMVADAAETGEALAEMLPLLEDAVLVAHHAAFDLAFLQKALAEEGYLPFNGRVLDTIDFLRMLYPSLSSYQLSMVCSAFGIKHERPHQADSDADATARVWLACLRRMQSLPLLVLQRLVQIFETDGGDLGWMLREFCREKELQTAVDHDAGNYFRHFALRVNDWMEDEAESEAYPHPLLELPFEQFYEQMKRNMADILPSFENRGAQDEMAAEVFSSFMNEDHLLAEAGTGTGKSLGYLIPALYFGLRENKRVLVSTHTIQLQEQLRQRDLPLLAEIFPAPFLAAVMKGRSHYLCLRKFEHKMNQRDYDAEADERITAAQMIVWLAETASGDDEELHLGPKGAAFWHTVASDTDSCLNRSCPWFRKCFYHRARNEAQQADLLIANHSLLFTDIKAENRLLPSYKRLVIDEAHHFEDAAGKHLGLTLHYQSLANSLAWLYKEGKSGLLSALRLRLTQADAAEISEASWAERIEPLFPLILSIREHWEQLTELLFRIVSGKEDGSQQEAGQFALRIKSDAAPCEWPHIAAVEDNIHLLLNDLLRKLDSLMNEWKAIKEEAGIQGLLTDLAGVLKELHRQRDALRFFVGMEDNNFVYWLEANAYGKHKSLQMIAAPVDVSPLLEEHIFAQIESVVLTSATLSVSRSFDYICRQLGLTSSREAGRLKTMQLESPFNYREQALVCIPQDFPSVKGSLGDQAFIQSLTRSLAEVAVETNGRMLVLFTSNRMLKQVYHPLKEKLFPYGIQVFGQGVDSRNRSKLTQSFLTQSASVLLGTSSFWEGVDIPGEALSCLAIVRLPFQPPNHPLVEAKSEMYKRQKQNSFIHFSVPQAVIRFKQGFGRLVRRATDKGIVIVYDTRVIDTDYGKYFLNSLPGPTIERMDTSEMASRIKQWMGGDLVEKR